MQCHFLNESEWGETVVHVRSCLRNYRWQEGVPLNPPLPWFSNWNPAAGSCSAPSGFQLVFGWVHCAGEVLEKTLTQWLCFSVNCSVHLTWRSVLSDCFSRRVFSHLCACVCMWFTLESLTVVLLPVEIFLQLMHLLPGVLHVQHLQDQMVDVLHAGRGRLWSRVLLYVGCLCLLKTRQHTDFYINLKDF